jgi:hypothetical protein
MSELVNTNPATGVCALIGLSRIPFPAASAAVQTIVAAGEDLASAERLAPAQLTATRRIDEGAKGIVRGLKAQRQARSADAEEAMPAARLAPRKHRLAATVQFIEPGFDVSPLTGAEWDERRRRRRRPARCRAALSAQRSGDRQSRRRRPAAWRSASKRRDA